MNQNSLKLKKELSDHELAIFNSEMEKYKKSTGLAYLLWLFLGTLGIHKFYIGKIGMGILYLVLGIAAWTSLVIGLTVGIAGFVSESEPIKTAVDTTASETGMAAGMILFIIFIILLGIMLLIDLFTIPRQIRKAYEKKEFEVLQKIKSI